MQGNEGCLSGGVRQAGGVYQGGVRQRGESGGFSEAVGAAKEESDREGSSRICTMVLKLGREGNQGGQAGGRNSESFEGCVRSY